MTIDRSNISTEYQPKGSDRNQSDTLDRPVSAEDKVAPETVPSKPAGEDAVVDEKGRPLRGNDTLKRT